MTPMLARATAGIASPRILDCGCGTGSNLEMLRPFGKAVGFDLTRIGTGFARAHGHRVAQGRMFAAGHPLAELRFDGVPSPYPFALMIPQSETERLLDEVLRSRGLQVERSVELIGFQPDADGVTAQLRHPNGTEETVRAAWLLGCDGAHSSVRHGLNMDFAGEADTLIAMRRRLGPKALVSADANTNWSTTEAVRFDVIGYSAGGYCVDAAAQGLRERGYNVRVLGFATAAMGGASGAERSATDLRTVGHNHSRLNEGPFGMRRCLLILVATLAACGQAFPDARQAMAQQPEPAITATRMGLSAGFKPITPSPMKTSGRT